MGNNKTVTNIRDIDWNRICAEARRERSCPGGSAAYWDKRALSFARNASKSDYVGKFLRFIDIRSHWTVLDVGCAAGTIAIPLSKMAKMITAMDISAKMLALFRERCVKLAVPNVRTVKGGWEDDWDELGIGEHDVAVASRSLITADFCGAIIKLNNITRKRVYLSTIVGDGPLDRRVFEALGRELLPGPDYIYIYNLLCQMGITSNVNFITYQDRTSYHCPEDAFEVIKCRFEEMNEKGDETLRQYLKEHLVCRNGSWEMSYRRNIRWAVFWWDKK